MLDHLSHQAKVALYVAGVFEELKARGMVQGTLITMKGLSTYDQLVTEGFKPSISECNLALRHGYHIDDANTRHSLLALIRMYQDDELPDSK